MLLDRPAGLRPGRRPDGARRRPVRVDAERLDVDVRDPVRPGDHHRRDLAEDRRVAGVGAAVEEDPGRPGEDRPVLGEPGLDVDDHRVGHLVGRDELLAPAEHEPDRPPRGPGERGDVGLEVEVALAAEPAAEVADDDADAMLGDLEDLGGHAPGGERDLRARVDRHPVARPVRGDGVRLDRDGMGHVGDVALADDDRRRGERRRRVALHDRRAARDVAGRVEVRVVGVRRRSPRGRAASPARAPPRRRGPAAGPRTRPRSRRPRRRPARASARRPRRRPRPRTGRRRGRRASGRGRSRTSRSAAPARRPGSGRRGRRAAPGPRVVSSRTIRAWARPASSSRAWARPGNAEVGRCSGPGRSPWPGRRRGSTGRRGRRRGGSLLGPSRPGRPPRAGSSAEDRVSPAAAGGSGTVLRIARARRYVDFDQPAGLDVEDQAVDRDGPDPRMRPQPRDLARGPSRRRPRTSRRRCPGAAPSGAARRSRISSSSAPSSPQNGVADDEDLVGPEQLLADDERADRVVGGEAAGVADDVGVAGPQARAPPRRRGGRPCRR